VSAIRMERCPPSPWNSVRHHRGMLSAIRAERRPGWRGIRTYLNERFGWREGSPWPLGAFFLRALPVLRRRYDRDFRHLPRATPGGRLLDVGCGSGDFLVTAKSCGWNAFGIDTDSNAVRYASSRGLDVKVGGIEHLEASGERFDVITLSHVLEHLHDPRSTLAGCLRLLKPGGRLWLETPNALALGHEVFGSAWRGLECPRHLVLFNRDNLFKLLAELGFERVATLPRQSALRPLFKESLALAEGRPLGSRRRIKPLEQLRLMVLQLWELIDSRRTEVLTVEAYRGEGTF